MCPPETDLSTSPENPYASPEAASGPPAAVPVGTWLPPAEDDIDLTRPSGMVKAGAFLTVATGLLTVLVGIQLLLLVTLVVPWLRLVPYALLAGGFGILWLGYKTLRTRGWAAMAATGANALVTLAMGYWVLFTAASGFFSLYALALPPLALVATVFAALAIPPCRRADAARERLATAGVEMGF